ncbi:DEAD/DEAH box helicase [Corynebacterium sp. H127]|uniref:DEAD/DEAH box helicase n=1 Tax=Corynebacterium sp. H127 TaxID=3133418 RepID=UPI00309D4638
MDSRLSALELDTKFGFINADLTSPQHFEPHLIANENSKTMLAAIREELRTAQNFRFSIAFISSSGLALLKQALLDFPGRGTIVTSRYLDFNHPNVFRELLLLDNVEVHIYDEPGSGFHAKGYVFERSPFVTAIVGSSNLTDTALVVNQEWNLKFSAHQDGDISYQIADAINRQLASSVPLSTDWVDEYERTRRPRVQVQTIVDDSKWSPETRIEPNAMQEQALEAIDELRAAGERRAVVVSATGTGKTILAALAVRNANPKKMLFVVHREQILDKAISEFQKVLELPREYFGKFVGARREIDCRFVFASIQSLSRPENLSQIPPAEFDYIVIDEVHRSGAESYQRLIDHFTPDFLLGLTATPERTDGFNVFELFDYNVPYEIRLQAALEEDMLVPFHYFGVTDFVNERNETVTDTSDLRYLVAEERVNYVLEKIADYGHPGNARGLIFCSRKDEAKELSALLNRHSLFGRPLRTKSLTGENSMSEREQAVAELESGQLDYILTVDIFNEGIDVPSINQIVMLRATQSSIIFTQQLGRGLRKCAGKDHLRVIDFIGNYSNNYLIPIALYGNRSRQKDKIRQDLIENKNKTIAGVSSVNFDAIAQQRILASLAKARIGGKFELKQDILLLKDRLNKLPRLFDFARFNTVDPVLISTKYGSYWRLLNSLKLSESAPTEPQEKFLVFLSTEILNGKRPHELLLIKHLLDTPKATLCDISRLFESEQTSATEQIVTSALRILGFEFLTDPQRSKYGGNPIIQVEKGEITLSSEFSAELADESFRNAVLDIIETGLFMAREQHSWRGEMVVGQRYSRRDVCRLLNWQNNNESTIYGYKVDKVTSTCPIFVTYHKDADVEASVSYEDAFESPNVLHWFTRSRRTLASAEVASIVSNEVDLHVFVKKDDAEGTDFFYLGTARASNEVQQKMPGNDGAELDVVSMDLNLASEVERSLFDYLDSKI